MSGWGAENGPCFFFHTCPHTTTTHELFVPRAESGGGLNSFHITSKAGTVASLF